MVEAPRHWTVDMCGKMFFGMMTLALQSSSPMDASVYGGWPAIAYYVTAL